MNTATYDIIIVGGGTAGLVLANRLSEEASRSILVIEAGTDASSDPRVVIPALFNSITDSEHAWSFATTPQGNLQGRVLGHPQGKLVGGSSAINAQALVPPSVSDIDAWEKLGNPGWNYKALKPYLDKFFTLQMPEEEVSEHLHLSWVDNRNFSGPVNASFAGAKEDPLAKAWVETFENLNYPLTQDPFQGNSIGAYNGPSTIEGASKTRSHAGTAYYLPVADRGNLHLITNSTVLEVILKPETPSSKELCATGVKYIQDGITKTALARKETIISAGVFNTPKLLELSGIGDASILQSHKIPVKINNPYIGTNLQDHILNGISFEAKDGIYTGDDLLRGDQTAIAAAMEAFQTLKKGPFCSGGITSFACLPPDFSHPNDTNGQHTLLQMLANQQKAGSSISGHPLDAYRATIAKTILTDMDKGAAQYCLFAAQSNVAGRNTTNSMSDGLIPGNFITFVVALSHPLSTGTVHISSANPEHKPTIDHKYFSNVFDLELHARHVRFLERIAATQPMASFLKPGGARNHPMAFVGDDLDKAKEFAKFAGSTNWHSCGTCAMAPKESGGVVDHEFRLYGVKGLRVVDASIMPLIPQSNIQSVVYAVAEKAVDIIKESGRHVNAEDTK